MNIQEYDLMNVILEKPDMNQRELAVYTGFSLGKVNHSLQVLTEKQYLDADRRLTEKALAQMEDRKPQNAVILAAGYGMRMVPINVEVPKGLLEIKGEPLIERLICQLHEAGIEDIDIIVGFMKEQYEYLIDKYNVNLVFNKEYTSRNNLHSLKCAVHKLGNTYIIPCDIWCRRNPFSDHEWYSWYMVTDEEDERSSVRVNRKKELAAVKKGEKGNRMIGISYILRSDAEKLCSRIRDYAGKKEYDQSFWEAALIEKNRMVIGPREVKKEDVHEINTYEQLRELDSGSDHLQSDIIQLICEVFSCSEDEVTEIRSLKKGMTNRSFEFRCRDKRYIMRIPGEGTDQMISRRNEYSVYAQLNEKNITDPVVYISSDNGYKITEFIEGARTCDSESPEDVKRCMRYLRKFHELDIQVQHKFDLFGQIEYYESLWGSEPSAYRDYEDTKKKIYELKDYIDAQPRQLSLTHIDAVCDNFLMKGERIYLIDWEYAGMQDVHVDIAMFAIYAMYDKCQIDRLIEYYFDGRAASAVKIKIYCYIAICGLLWSNWCEYKRICGVEFGEYSLKQYRYAKEFYRIAKGELEEGRWKHA